MRASRLLSILILLQLRQRLTAEVLAAEFEVSVRTIYRDIDALSAAGIPVYGDKGPGGGFQLLDGYRTRLTGLASDEAEAMLMIGLPGPAAALGLGAAAGRAKGKLLAALTSDAGKTADRISGRFHLDPADWYRAADNTAFLPGVARAVLDQHPIAISYESWTRTHDHGVDPLGLVLKGGGWYLVARAKTRLQTFKVANIKSLKVQAGLFERPAGFDLVTHWTAQLLDFEDMLRPHLASIVASPAGSKRLSADGAYAARAIAETGVADKNSWTCFSLPYENIDQAARLLLGIGPEFKVLAPAELQARVGLFASQIAEQMLGDNGGR
jgi:predicted DNA-binding transcriptional regulator YafY